MSITTITVPDHIGAIISYLREHPVLTDLVRIEDITARMPLTVDSDTERPLPPRPHLGLVKSPGLRHSYLPILYHEVDFRCYGSTGLNAMNVWRAAHSILFPAGMHGIPATFTRRNCRITHIAMSMAPIDQSEQLWPFVIASYLFTVHEVMTNVA